MATVCQNKNRRWCLMYDNTNHRCHGLMETNDSRTCTFFKDRRYLTTEQREKYKKWSRAWLYPRRRRDPVQQF